jgi:hypothetical protein
LLTPVVHPATTQLATASEATHFSYWSIKPWFLFKGKIADVLIIPSSWGSPTFSYLWFGIYIRLLSQKYKIMSWKRKEFEDLDDFSFLLDFIL